MRRLLVATVTAGALLGAGQAALPASAGSGDPPANPCFGPARATLLCPDLEMYPPYDLYAERTSTGRVRLRAGNVIESSGRGPVELRGRRNGERTMSVRQRNRADRTQGLLLLPRPGQGRPVPGLAEEARLPFPAAVSDQSSKRAASRNFQ